MSQETTPSRTALDILLEAGGKVRKIVEEIARDVSDFPQTYFQEEGKVVLKPGIIVDVVKERNDDWAVTLTPKGLIRHPLISAREPETGANILVLDTLSSSTSLVDDYLMYGWKALDRLETIKS